MRHFFLFLRLSVFITSCNQDESHQKELKSESLLFKLKNAFNTRDIESLMECFDKSYSSEQPVHPSRSFQGPEQVRKNWSSSFQEMPDFTAVLLSHEIEKDTIWAEWDWKGTRQDESKLHMRGVTILGVIDSKIKRAKLYMEPVEINGGGIDASIKEVMQGKEGK